MIGSPKRTTLGFAVGRDSAVLGVVLTAIMGVLAGGVVAVPTVAGDAATTVTDIPLAGGVMQRGLTILPTGTPHAGLILFSGGAGVLQIESSGKIDRPGNFLVRTRQR